MTERALIEIVPYVGPGRGGDTIISEGRRFDSFPAFLGGYNESLSIWASPRGGRKSRVSGLVLVLLP